MNIFYPIDYILDRITMYRLVMYELLLLIAVTVVYGFFGVIDFSSSAIIFSTAFLLVICWSINKLLSWAFDAPVNVESHFITALILALIVTPAQTFGDFQLLFWIAVLAMGSKYLLALHKKHLFNPAAIALVITTFALGESASWWIGNAWMMPFVLITGLLLVRKLRLSAMVWSFFASLIFVSMIIVLSKDGNILTTLQQMTFNSAFIYMGTFMLTDPLTLPSSKKMQMLYGVLVGFLAVPQVSLGGMHFAPELALCIGNLFAYIVSPKTKLFLSKHEKIQLAPEVFDFVYTSPKRLQFTPGQYMEWTLPHDHPDSRGNRRYFTLASSPTEDTLRLGIKFYDKSSSYKKALLAMDANTLLVGSHITGDFTLPTDKHKKLVFIAGGIGITPYRSMLKYLIDNKEKRDITLFYSNSTAQEIIYRDIIDSAAEQLGIKTVFIVTGQNAVTQDGQTEAGRITKEMFQKHVPDVKDRVFYLSGPFSLITACERLLHQLGVKQQHIKKDFFPGFV